MTRQDNNRNGFSGILVMLGLLIMLVMALLPLLNINHEWMRWTFAVGALAVLVGRIVGLYHGPSLRVRRLHRLLITSGLLYCASAVMMFVSRGTNDWIAFLLAGLVMQIYATWMIDRETEKNEE